MPSIDIQLLEGVFSDAEKAEIIRRVTDVLGAVGGEAIRDGTSVRVHEVRSGCYGYAGKALTTQDALAMRARG
ncbi:4-oxalocrotonate tautomerase [Jannaschia faecimaris]|uniref:4-oxalocrotonate tautomerase n=1 Tax=Jannaschia faecimaris TaxID=1244108 RepID=A0A1H3QYT1_9RHOB|nr:tautomerase family protein [Jannaschia faecimaris]SDZ18251.1 4-oxalocrotonate tautomerase [Jannaschia faecimaris]